MVSRIKNNPATIFDVFVEMASPSNRSDKTAFVLWKYPEDYHEEKLLKHVAEFAFPCQISDEAVQLFSFVLTDEKGNYTFGYCRHAPKSNTCLCFLSALPWVELFYKFLNHIAAVMNASSSRGEEVEALLVRAYHQDIPNPGDTFIVDSSLGRNKMECICPDDSKLPRIPDNRHLTEYYNAVDEHNMKAVWASMLCERRIIFVSNKLGRLSSCVIAANLLIYPMHWQHIFVPVLPEHLFFMLQMPMPFLVGVPTASYLRAAKETDLSEVVVLNVDTKEFHSSFNDYASLPPEVTDVLKKNLRTSNHLLGDGVSRSFLRATVVLLGGYRESLVFRPGEKITFSREKFVQCRAPPLQPFLERMLELQIFTQFIDDRLRRLNGDGTCRDEFEEECTLYSGKDNNRLKYQYQHYVGNVKKNFVTSFQDKANPMAFQQAVEKMKTKSKDTFKDIKDKLNEIKVDTTIPTKKLDIFNPKLTKIPSASELSNSESQKEFKYQTLESENFLPKQSNVDLLQEIEHILTEQTPILAALEKQNGDKCINGGASFSGASGRLKGSKSAEHLLELSSQRDPGVYSQDLFKKCSVNRSRTSDILQNESYNSCSTINDHDKLLIDFGPAPQPTISLSDVVFDPLLRNSSSSSTVAANQDLVQPSSSNVELLADFLGSSKNYDQLNGCASPQPCKSTTLSWETFE